MFLTHKIELRPTAEQSEQLFRCAGTSRHLYNQLLDHFSQKDVKFSVKTAREVFYSLRENKFPWYAEISQAIPREAIKNLESAYKMFFKGAGKYPKFKKKGIKTSFSIRESRKFRVEGRNLFFEKFNKGKGCKPLKMRERLRFSGAEKSMTISFKGGKWFVSILIEVEGGYNFKEPSSKVVGVDLGIKELAFCSNGETFGKSNKLKGNLGRLARLQRKLAKQVKGSNRRAKTKSTIAKLHTKVSNQRSALLHKVSDSLTSRFSTICIENLNVKGMTKNRRLARAVSDCGFYELRRQLEYKASLRGGEVKVIDRWFPSSKLCSRCGTIKKDLKLSDRTYECDCGLKIDRDLNAAMNIEAEGLRV